jgi:hypothetical protein
MQCTDPRFFKLWLLTRLEWISAYYHPNIHKGWFNRSQFTTSDSRPGAIVIASVTSSSVVLTEEFMHSDTEYKEVTSRFQVETVLLNDLPRHQNSTITRDVVNVKPSNSVHVC